MAGSLGRYFTARAQANGLIVRGVLDTIALCPPLIINEQEIDWLLERFKTSLVQTQRWFESQA